MRTWIKSALLGAFLVCATAGAAYGLYVGHQWKEGHKPRKILIQNNEGGILNEFLDDFAAARSRHDTYKIDGFCVSACTFITGLIPRDRICITSYARFGFHSAFWTDDKNVRHFSLDGSAQMFQVYPDDVQAMLKRHGWKDPAKYRDTIIWIGFDELKTLFRECGPKE